MLAVAGEVVLLQAGVPMPFDPADPESRGEVGPGGDEAIADPYRSLLR